MSRTKDATGLVVIRCRGMTVDQLTMAIFASPVPRRCRREDDPMAREFGICVGGPVDDMRRMMWFRRSYKRWIRRKRQRRIHDEV